MEWNRSQTSSLLHSHRMVWMVPPKQPLTTRHNANARVQTALSPHLSEIARAFLVRVTELCGAAFWRKTILF